MADKKTSSDQTAHLRQKAEEMSREKAALSPEDIKALSPEEIGEMFHELRVHQIELEMQNEELRRAQVELDAARARYFDLYDLAPVGYVTISEKGLILEANLTAAGLLGVARDALVKQFVTRFILKEDQDAYYLHRKQLFETGTLQVFDLRMVKKGGTAFWAHLAATAAQDVDGAPICRVMLSDITDRKQAEESLRESEEKFRKAFLITPDAIAITRLSNGRFVSVNQGFTNILGYTDADMVGKSSLELNIWVNPEDRKKIITELQANGIVENYEATFRTKTGALCNGLMSSAIIELNGERHIINSARDITERKQAEEVLRLLSARQQALLSAIPDIIMEVDRNKVYTWANQTGIEFFGEDVVGKEAAFYFVGEQDTYGVVQPLFNGDENVIYVESWQRRKDGGKRLLAWWCRELKDERGNVTGALSSGRDITERKQQEAQILAAQAELQELLAKADQARRALLSVVEDQKMAEEEIRRLNTELEQRVADRTAQLETSNKELEAFAYSVSHDLRAPLRAIDGFSRILQQEYAQKLDDEGLRLLGVVRDNTSRMDGLITNLLALSRVGRSELRYSPIDMTTLTNSIYHELATPEVLVKFVFRVSDLPRASGDPTLIRQVWTNLISNAIKYTLPIVDPAVFGGKKECVIEINGWKKDGLCTYSIKDSGVGFNPKYADKLFGLFQRLHKAGEFEGTGVGLAIVQRIIHRHGGQVWGEGQVGAGATFYFTLPERQENQP